ncbi:MAG: twin-arginine translocation pathway signal protein [Pseudomonadota bacterium]
MKRRAFLGILGGGIILAAGGVGYRITRKPQTALKPWTMAGQGYSDPRKEALSYAILAPNPHNRQPWLVDLAEPGVAVLYADTTRLLPETDPQNRQITIGLGCFLELLTMAAAQTGHRLETNLFPEGSDPQKLDKRPVAHIRFIKDAAVQPDPLFAHVMARRTNKEPYDTARPVAKGSLDKLLPAARETQMGGSVDPASIERLRKLTETASTIEFSTPRTHQESVDLFRIGYKEVDANPDGIDFSGTFFETLALAGQLDRESLADPNSTQFKQSVPAILEPIRSAMGHVWITTKDNSRESQIAAGRDWLRFHLACTRDGIAFNPHSQCLQEFPEMAGLYKEVHELLAKPGETVQMLGRIGYAAPVAPSPRWPMETRLV